MNFQRINRAIESKWTALFLAFISAWALSIAAYIPYRSFVYPVVMGALFAAYSRQLKKGLQREWRQLPLAGVSLLLALITVVVNFDRYAAHFSGRLFKLMGLLTISAGLWCVLFLCLQYLASKPVYEQISRGIEARKHSAAAWPDRHDRAVTFFLCLLCWLPYYLQEYPGVMTADTISQLQQVMGVSPLSNHHPLFHTAFIWLFTNIGFLFTDDINYAVGLYTTAQMVFMAWCASICVGTLKRMGVHLGIRLLAMAFFAFLPFNAVFAVTIWKDVPFGGVCLLLVCAMMELVYAKDIPKTMWVRFTVICILFCLMRNNGWYAFLLLIPCLLAAFRRHIKAVAVCIAVSVAVCLAIKGPLYKSLDVVDSDFIESCSIPLQQICRVVAVGKDITEEERDMIGRVMDVDAIPEDYTEWLSDPMKNCVRAGDQTYLIEHKADYLKLWIKLGLRYPATYMRAWIAQTSGYYNPEAGIEYWVFASDVQKNKLGLENRNPLPDTLQQKIGGVLYMAAHYRYSVPVYGLVWSIGLYTWVLLTNIALVLHQKRNWERIIILLVPLAVVCTLLIATPVAYEFRYAYGVIFSAPAWVLLPWMKNT